MMLKLPYNSRKCTSASSLNACIHRFLLKAIIALPTQTEIVNLFKQTFIGGAVQTQDWDLTLNCCYQKIQIMNQFKTYL